MDALEGFEFLKWQFTQCANWCLFAKYASVITDALVAPKAGDKKTYQMDFRNRREALLETSLDIAEGADIRW